MDYVYEFLGHVSILSVCLPFITGLILYKKLDTNSRVLVILLFFATIAQVSTYSTWADIFYNIYTVLDPVFWGYLFFRNSKNQWIKMFILVTTFVQPVLSLSRFYSLGLSDQFYSQLVCLNNVLLLLWVLSFFYERYYTENIQALEKEPLFWFCLGILIYAPCSYFYFAFHETVRFKTNPFSVKIKAIHDLLNTAEYLIFTIGIYINVRKNAKYQNAFN
jgi:hypothetical protein